MKKDIKGFIAGVIFAVVGITTVSATAVIESAEYNSNRVIIDGRELELSQPMISVINQGDTHAVNYMPVRGVLEAMGYEVDWDGEKKAVIVTTKTGEDIHPATEEVSTEAIEEISTEVSQIIYPTIRDEIGDGAGSTEIAAAENTETAAARDEQHNQEPVDVPIGSTVDFTVNPTETLLNGMWVTSGSGVTQAKYKFSPGGRVERIVDIYGKKDYALGSFRIDGSRVTFEYAYQDDGVSKRNLSDNEIIKESYTIKLSEDGRSMMQSVEAGGEVIKQVYDKYSGNDFFEYGNPVSLPGGTTPVSRELLAGKWSARSGGKVIKYSFDSKGGAAEFTDDGELKTFRRGTYNISGGKVQIEYSYIFDGVTNSGSTRSGGTTAETLTLRFSADGKKMYRQEGNGSSCILFTGDTCNEFSNYQ